MAGENDDWMAALGLSGSTPAPAESTGAGGLPSDDDEVTLPPPMNDAGLAPGWFGKVSCLGDFAQRRLESQTVERLDRWLSDCMAASRQALGDTWLDAYLNGPVWRFALAPGVLDDRWWFGVVMPSVDNVGRYFPLWIGACRPAPPTDTRGFNHLDAWHDHLNAIALAMLEPGGSLDGFELGLADAPAWPAPTLPETGAQTDELRVRYRLGGASVREFAAALALHGWLNSLQGHSLWWTKAGGLDPQHLTVTQGLPSPFRFTQLLDGSW